MEILAQHRKARSSAQKIRVVANLIRGKKVLAARKILYSSNKKASTLIKKVMESAVSNAEHNKGIDVKYLRINKILVDEGPSMKRTMPRAKGRADHILKRSSHIIVVVTDN